MNRETFTVISDSTNTSDIGKVRIDNVGPALPPSLRGMPRNISDSGKVRIGNFSPAFPPLCSR